MIIVDFFCSVYRSRLFRLQQFKFIDEVLLKSGVFLIDEVFFGVGVVWLQVFMVVEYFQVFYFRWIELG